MKKNKSMLGHEEVSKSLTDGNGDLWYQSYHAMLPANEGLLPSSLKIHDSFTSKVPFMFFQFLPRSILFSRFFNPQPPHLVRGSWGFYPGSVLSALRGHVGSGPPRSHPPGVPHVQRLELRWSPPCSFQLIFVGAKWLIIDTSYQNFTLCCFLLVLLVKLLGKFSMDTGVAKEFVHCKTIIGSIEVFILKFQGAIPFSGFEFWETQATVGHHSWRWWRICTTNISLDV